MALEEESSDRPSISRPQQVLVCQYHSCLAVSSDTVLAAFRSQSPSEIEIIAAPCQGQCSSGPTVRILPEETWYCRVSQEDVPRIVKEHLQGGNPVLEKLHPRIHRPYDF